jgi:hypothetical protein
MVQRRTISIPDELDARLERLQDRLNVSKVCATALEREVRMLEGRTALADPRLEELIRRLQTAQERWYRRGHDDGTAWAIETATREELSRTIGELVDQTGDEIAKRRHNRFGLTPWFPKSFKIGERLDRWAAEDEDGGSAEPPGALAAVERPEAAEVPGPDGTGAGEARPAAAGAPNDAPARHPQARVEVDEGSYLAGWRDAVKDIWQAVAPALRS